MNKMKKSNYTIIAVLLVISLVFVQACKKDDYPEVKPREYVSLITGTWNTVQVLQTDIIAVNEGLQPTTKDRTALFNFTDFKITFNSSDGNPTTFTVDPGEAPNYVDLQGTWQLDDYSEPGKILLTADGANSPTSEFYLLGPPREGAPLYISYQRTSGGKAILSYDYKLTK
jgi:hypothetical protein